MTETKLEMKNMFKGYTNYTEDEYRRVWENSIIVVDTNILLNLYRYSEETRKELLTILKCLKKRLWIPYQVGKEYFNNKNTVMSDSYNDFSKLEKELIEAIEMAKGVVYKKKNNYLNCKDTILDLLNTTNEKIIKLLKDEKSKKEPQFEDNEIEKEIIKLFNNSIGEPFSDEEMVKIREEGKKRFENKIPPGYKDDKKEENGDYYIFYSMMKKAKEMGKDVIFITDDVKEDWFNEVNGQKHGGRYELLDEFYKETKKLLMIYTSDGFARAYGKNVKEIESERFIDELINVRINYAVETRKDEVNQENELINKLNLYKNYLININDVINKEELFKSLNSLFRNENLPYDYYYGVHKIIRGCWKNLMNEDPKAIKLLITKINNVIAYLCSEKHFTEQSEEKIKEKLEREYKKYLNELSLCKNQIELEILAEEINKTIERHIDWLPNKEDNQLLRYSIRRISQIINNLDSKDNTLESNKKRIKLRLEMILNNMERH